MKKLLYIFIGIIVILGILLTIFPPRKISNYWDLKPPEEKQVCKGVLIKEKNKNGMSGYGGICFGRIEKVENETYDLFEQKEDTIKANDLSSLINIENAVTIQYSAAPQDWTEYKDEVIGLRISIPPDYVQLKSLIGVPNNQNAAYEAIKFIPKDRVENLGKRLCFYGENDEPSLCNIRSEEGITIAVLDGEILEMITGQHVSLFDNVTIGDVQGIRFRVGAEGSGQDTYMFEVGANKTLLIVGLYNEYGKFLSSNTVETILGTMSLK